MVHEPDDLAHRIDRLERDARRWRCAAVILGGLLGIVGLLGATTVGPVPVAEEIRARRFVVVDEAGRTRLMAGVEGGRAVLALEGPEPMKLTAILTVDDSAGVLVFGREAQILANLTAGKNGTNLGLHDYDDNLRAVLGSTSLLAPPTGTIEQRPPSSLVLFDKDGTVLFKAP